MPHHKEQRFLPYSAQQMYDLVVDVRRYPEFLPWVMAMRVRTESEHEIVADMIVGFTHLREQFTSRVVKLDGRRVEIDYLDGPLKELHNVWQFSNADGGCLIDFEVKFAFKNRVFQAIAGQFFDAALRKMIAAFETRAQALYGQPAA
jgi:coenzyme Q-binding protein COQ10